MRSTSPSSAAWLRPSVIMAVVAVAAAGVTLLVSPTSRPPVPSPDGDEAAPVVQARAGAWYCADEAYQALTGPAEDPGEPTATAAPTPTPTPVATPTPAEPASPTPGPAPAEGDGVTSRVVAVRDPGGNRPATWTSRGIGQPGIDELGEVFPGTTRTLSSAADEALEVRWTDEPMAVHRLTTVALDPGGVLARPCPHQVSREWFVPGVTTASGVQVTLRITNPLNQDAAVAVEGLTPQGLENPLDLQNLSVPAGETLVVDVNDHLPQLSDLALRVIARSGRVVVDASLASRPTISGVAGRSAVPAVASPATRWLLPWVTTTDHVDGRGSGPVEPGSPLPTATPDATEAATTVPDPDESTPEAEPPATGAPDAAATGAEPSDGETPTPEEEATGPDADDILDVTVEGDATPSSWIWLANPDPEATAQVTVSWLTSAGREPADVLGTVAVGPSSLRRINVDELAPNVPGDIGMDIQVTNDVPLVVSSGVIVDDGEDSLRTGLAIVSAVASPDNLVEATTAAAGREQWLTVANPFGEATQIDLDVWNGSTSQAPEPLQDLVVPAGATVSVDLSAWATGDEVFTVFVTAATDGAVTASLRSLQADGRLDFSATHGVPEAIWSSPAATVGVVNEPGLVNRFGTGLGLPVEVPSPTPSPSPTPTGTPAGTPTSTATGEPGSPASPAGPPDTSPGPS